MSQSRFYSSSLALQRGSHFIAASRNRIVGPLLLLIVMISYKIALDYIYSTLIVSRDSDELYIYDPETTREFISYFLVVALSILLSADASRRLWPSRLAIYLYVVFIAVPLLTIYGLGQVSPTLVLLVIGALVLALFTIRILPALKIKPPSGVTRNAGLAACCVITAYVYGNLVLTGGMSRFNLNLLNSEKLYSVRSDFIATLSPLMGYLLDWQSDVINMAILIIGLQRRSLSIISVALLMEIWLVAMTNYKSALLAPLLVVGIYMLFSKRNFLTNFTAISAIVVVASLFVFRNWNIPVFVDTVVDRLIFFPAQLHSLYYEYFATHEHLFLSNSMLSWLVEYPYSASPPQLIASTFLNNSSSPNVGFLADAYSQFGAIGVFVFTIVLCFFMKILDSLAMGMRRNVAAAAISMPVMSLTNSALFTTLLTGGLLFALVIVWLLSDERRTDTGPGGW